MAFKKSYTKFNWGQRTVFNNYHEATPDHIKQFAGTILVDGKEVLVTHKCKFRIQAINEFEAIARELGGKFFKTISNARLIHMQKFAHKGFLVSVTKATEKGVIETQYGKAIICPNDLILTDKNGNTQITTEELFKQNYVPVEEVVESEEDLASTYAEALQAFSLDSTEEDYTEFQKKVRERNSITY
ncbi:hypothetical protein BAOM_2952 [Peribacillus asahii]|uniref:Uncharacterized protein n=1 Tax=Peribacillus asahii TaxID=228899 RepID=A0A3Q9RP23_9BACI|nr:hypothetical protein [Peribacillus asahii]AZV43561.1 hypothetical protein BAOM_2952 [Peribacillus asahii]